jgi:hypothetical protein
MGYSVTSLAKNTRQTGLKASPKGPRGMENALELAQLFAERYPYNGKSQSTDLDAVEKYIKSQFSDPENFSIEGEPVTDEVAAQVCWNQCRKHVMHNTQLTTSFLQITEKYKTTTKLNTQTFLEGLANSLHSEGMNLTFDYFRLHRFCWMLPRAVKDACSSSLRQLFGPSYIERETQLPFVVGYLFMCAFSADKLGKEQGVEARSQVFGVAMEPMEGLIETGAGGICVKILEQFFNYAADWEDFERLQYE